MKLQNNKPKIGLYDFKYSYIFLIGRTKLKIKS